MTLSGVMEYAAIPLAGLLFLVVYFYIKLRNLKQKADERTAELTQVRDDLLYDLHLARKVQRSLLPKTVPDTQRATLAYRYEPMMGVGGDFLDYAYDDERLDMGLFICDVSGHGVSAAMTAAMVKMSLGGWEKQLTQPAQVITAINTELQGKLGDSFVTMVAACINLETGELRTANAGHQPLVVLSRDGTIREINPRGIMVSNLFHAPYEESLDLLQPGDMVILYTDAILEAERDDEIYGEQRFSRTLTENRHLSPRKLCDVIYREISGFSSSPDLEDDFTVLIVQYHP